MKRRKNLLIEMRARRKMLKEIIKVKSKYIFKIEIKEDFDYSMELDSILQSYDIKTVYQFVTDGEIPPAVNEYITKELRS